MAFQSGITTSPNDLLDKIRLFATGVCGYTQLMYQADAGGEEPDLVEEIVRRGGDAGLKCH